MVKAAAAGRRKSRVDIVWCDRQAEVLAEVRRMIHSDNPHVEALVEPSSMEVFQRRTAAAKAVYARLTGEEQADIARQIGTDNVTPLPMDVLRQ